jgi:succinoglycan biosynthesis protein ExoU
MQSGSPWATFPIPAHYGHEFTIRVFAELALNGASFNAGNKRNRMPASHPTVCVIIAARNAAGTIGSAIRSALREDAVAEIIVVDDGSTDGTGEAAHAADDGTERLRVLRLDQNHGPAYARNRAIEASKTSVLAILNADDVFIEGRFERLLQDDDWDFVADNIVFLDRLTALSADNIEQFEPRPHFLTVSAFIEGNLSRPGVRRGELGFL